MSKFCCIACGGTLIKKGDSGLYVCEYCGTIQTDPSNSEKAKNTEIIRPNIEPIIKRTYMYLEDANWEKANEYADKILDIDPECAEAYLLKLMADERAKTEDRLIYLAIENDPESIGYTIHGVRRFMISDIKSKNEFGCNYNWEGNMNYIRACQYGSNELKARLSKYIEYRTYRTGLDLMNNAYYDTAMSLFQSVINCEDSKNKIEICKDRIREIEENDKRAKEIARQKEEQQKQAELKEKQREKISRILDKIRIILIIIIGSYGVYRFIMHLSNL